MSLPLHNSQSAVTSPEASGQEFSSEERALLLCLAHDSILSTLEGRTFSMHPPTPHLSELRGTFASLYLRGELRGCVGYVVPTSPLYRTVAEIARAAAFEDNRFPPVTKSEAPHLEIELSILSPLESIHADAIEIGRHGLLISQHGRRGLLLPQVAVEHQWDRNTFLEQTCRKAHLSPDAWQKGATLQAFTAEIFGDKIF
ncbi:MAG TPA: AmmeMemoRadiSam system protein A [Candidatus Deferrimicrobiaceae bacterium]|nr:AmmeMemoRadiSam system protein A [Candidatus Deferrimicrobiaceae bacterium]